MDCPSCGATVPGGKFCIGCGAPLPSRCPACGTANPPAAKFCGECGAGLTAAATAPSPAVCRAAGPPAGGLPEGERRQVTVLFADLCGYTRLSGELDAEEVHGLLSRFFEAVDAVIQSYGGRIDKHIGDCAMAVFGAPVAHGDDPERAVRAALAIHAAMSEMNGAIGRPLLAHVGIASGQVVASSTGSSSHQAYTVTGESVNLASRLTDMAGPGETLVSDAVRRALADLFDGEAISDVAVAGLDKPVRVWRLGALGGLAKATPRPFVGRRPELGQFSGAVSTCRETGGGAAVYLRGEAGIGKTRLVEEFRHIAEGQGFACHTGLALDFGVGYGRDAIRAVVHSLLGVPPGDDPEASRVAAERALAEGLVEAERRVYLNDLLNLPQPLELRALYDAMDNAARNRGKRATAAELVRRLSARRPLLIILEDLHWADPITLAHAAELTATVAECPAVLVMTSRLEGDPLDQVWRGQTRGAPLVTMDLGPLRRLEALALAGAFLDASERLAQACVERAEGNPLFLEQLLCNAEESAEASVPGSIQSLILARMDRLPPEDKRALQAASVLGQRFSLEALRHLIESPHYGCAGLLAHHLVRPEGDQFLFAHALIQEGVYSSLLMAARRELHRRAAGWFADRDTVLRAEHLDRANDPAAPRAYLEAARAQASAYHHERALRLAERGLALASVRADVYALTCFRGQILRDLGSVAQSIEVYERALEAAQDDVERCRAWIGLAAGMRVTDKYDQAFEALDRAKAAAADHGLTVELARIHHLRGNLYYPLANPEGCLREHEAALALARQAGSYELEASALSGMGDACFMQARMISAYGYYRRCIELCREHGFGRIEVANIAQLGNAGLYFREQPAVLSDSLAALEAAKRAGHLRAELQARISAVKVLVGMAELAHAKEQVAEARALVRRLGAWRFETTLVALLAGIAVVEERRSEAIELLQHALTISREKVGLAYRGATIFGGLALAAADPDERRRALGEGERLLRQGCLAHNHLSFYPDAMETALDMGDWGDVDRYAAALEAFTRSEPLPWADFYIARGRTLAAYGRGRRAEAVARKLERLRGEGERLGLRVALPALERALA